jgi:hypothetical protein
MVLTKRAQVLLALAGDGPLAPSLRVDLDEAATGLLDAGQYDLALTLFRRTQSRAGIEGALQASGAFEELDALLRQEQAAGQSERDTATRVAEAEMLMLAGDRRGATARLAGATAPALTTLRDRLTSTRAQFAPASLVVDGSPRRVWLDETIVVGRNEGQIRLSHAAVSRRHLELTRTGGHTMVRDLGSRNGTYLHGLPLGGPMMVEGRLELALGREAIVALTPTEDGSLRIDAGGECAFASFGPYPVAGIGTLTTLNDGWLELRAAGGALMLSQSGELQTNPVVTLLSGDRFARARGGAPALEVL